jgi:hypothetical protein
MPRKQKGTGLQCIRLKKTAKDKQTPSPLEEELLLPVDVADDKERVPDKCFVVDDDNTRTILEATSDKCATLNAMATWLAFAYQYLTVLGAPPPEDWDGRDGTVKILWLSLKFQRILVAV